MSKHFNNYSKNYDKPQVMSEPIPDAENIVATEEPAITIEELNEIAVAVADGTFQPVPEPAAVQPEPVQEVPVKKGIVVNCDKLNVRKAPTKGSEAIAKITKGNEVIINETESKGGFYKISTVSGIEGYCMKAYIEVK